MAFNSDTQSTDVIVEKVTIILTIDCPIESITLALR